MPSDGEPSAGPRSGPAGISPTAPPGLPQQALGHPRVHLRRTDSTNDRARALALAGAPHGTLITAAEQTAGRGRHGRRWWAPPGSALLMSLLLRRWPPLLPLAAAVAVCDVAGHDALVKWPNDVVVAAASGGPLSKMAGILIEGRPQDGWLVVGIGLNVAVDPAAAPAELETPIASMGRPAGEVEEVLAALLVALERRLSQSAPETVERWRALDALRGRPVSFEATEGIAEGIDDGGRLLVRAADGALHALASGEVRAL